MVHRSLSGLLLSCLVATLGGCTQTPPIEHIEGFAQGTTYQISFWSDQAIDLTAVNQQIDQTLAQIDSELSTYRPDSFISRFNESSSTDWLPASSEFLQLLDIAREVHTESEGCYDPTVQPLFALWGFQRGELQVPTDTQIAHALESVGLIYIEVDAAQSRIRKTLPGVRLDLSSMGEGYSIGRLSRVLEQAGIHNYLIEFGGDLYAHGQKPDSQAWRIAIEKPVLDGPERVPYRIASIINPNGVSLDTSGTYRRSYDAEGQAYSHILDPRTGAPVTHSLRSASVFGNNPAESDAWATAMLCLGEAVGAKVANKNALEVFFIREVDGQLLTNQSQALVRSKNVALSPID